MTEHLAGAEQQCAWIGDTAAGNIRRRAVHGLENCHVGADICAGSKTQTADQARAQITIPVCAPVPDLMAALRILDTAGIVPVDLGLRRPSLDDVFLSLTGRNTGDDDLAAPLATTPRAPRPARSAA